jgi:hypothetical protein
MGKSEQKPAFDVRRFPLRWEMMGNQDRRLASTVFSARLTGARTAKRCGWPRMNEVPTVRLIAIVPVVVIKPF